jgi:anion-transporting  ArsA/GET3 family ATPase
MISQQNPVKLFVGHVWDADEDYLRVFEFLSNARNFYYVNLSAPDQRPSADKEAQREALRQQIAPAEAVILLASHYRRAPDLVEFQANFAKASDKPVILLSSFGGTSAVSKTLLALADESVDWDERALVDAIRRQARHEETTRWDTIEFKPD